MLPKMDPFCATMRMVDDIFFSPKVIAVFLIKYLCFSMHLIRVTKITHLLFFGIIYDFILPFENIFSIFSPIRDIHIQSRRAFERKTTITHKRKEISNSFTLELTHFSTL